MGSSAASRGRLRCRWPNAGNACAPCAGGCWRMTWPSGRPGSSRSWAPRAMAELTDALAELARTDTLLVALDFDGTLAPLVDDPAAARALPEARAGMLALLDAPKTSVALISGRAMESLIAVSEAPDGILLSGSHGV